MFVQPRAPSAREELRMSVFSPRCRRVVVVGGGEAAAGAVRALASTSVDVTVVDEQESARPSKVTVVRGRVTGLDLARRRVLVGTGAELPYDALVIAASARFRAAGDDAWTSLAAADEALEARVRVALEFAESEPDEAERARLLTFVIAGGAAAAELARVVAESAARLVSPEFEAATGQKARVVLLAGKGGSAPPEVPGVEVRSGDAAEFGNIAAGTVLYAEGVPSLQIASWLGASGRLPLSLHLSPVGWPEVYVVNSFEQGAYVGRAISSMGVPQPYRRSRFAALRRLVAHLRGLSAAPVGFGSRPANAS